MKAFLDQRTHAILKACLPALEAQGMQITQEMYTRLLANKEIRALFNKSHQRDGKQIKALALALQAFARNIDNLSALSGLIDRITEKHVGLNIRPRHYPFVAEALLGAIAHILGDIVTPEILQAWGKAYWFLADILMSREAQIYRAKELAPGSWTGWRSFTIRDRVKESDMVTSFILEPSDGRAILRHQPGQYLSLHLDIPEHGAQIRHYSISSCPSDATYRISVRRVAGGVASCWLHEKALPGSLLQVSAPAGDFTLEEPVPKSIVLLSAGIGLTPMVSLLSALIDAQSRTSIHYIHVTQSPETEIFNDDIVHLARSGRIRADVFYSRSKSDRDDGCVTRHAGRISAEWLEARVDKRATYYICGPDHFVYDMVSALRRSGMPKAQIRYELFGSASVEDLVA